MAIPSYERRSFSETAISTTLASGISDSDSTCVIASATGWPSGSSGDFYIRIDSEDIRVDTRSATTLTFHASGRGANGTSAAAHSSGAAVDLVFTSFDADEANYVVSETVGKITATGQLLVADGANSLAALANGTSGLPLVAGASTPAYGTLASGALAADSVTATQIAANAVGSSELATDAVTTAKILDLNVTTGKLAANAVTGAKMANATVTETQLAASVAGDGLAGGAGTALSVGVDGSTVELSSDAVRVKDAGITGAKLNSNVVDNSTLAISSSQLIVKDAGLTSAKFNSEAATAWTPTISGTGWALGNGTVTGLYLKHGRRVLAQGLVTFGSTSTFGSGGLTIGGLPVAMNASIAGSGRVFINDASSGADYYGDWAIAANTTSGVVYVNGLLTTPAYVFRVAAVTAIPMTWANGDSVLVVVEYIAAS